MKESLGYTVTLNIIITFIVILFAFLAASASYFKANKVNNIIRDSIEKYEGYNTLSSQEINTKITSLGYNISSIDCVHSVVNKKSATGAVEQQCNLTTSVNGRGRRGYCVYLCDEGNYYFYKIKTNMMMNIPIISSIVPIPIFSNTNRMYNFG